MKYDGYLAPHLDLIRALRSAGATAPQISRHLYESGVKATWGCWSGEDEDNIASMTGMVNYVLRKLEGRVPKPRKERVTRIVQDWETWTPEMQAAEFETGYSR